MCFFIERLLLLVTCCAASIRHSDQKKKGNKKTLSQELGTPGKFLVCYFLPLKCRDGVWDARLQLPGVATEQKWNKWRRRPPSAPEAKRRGSRAHPDVFWVLSLGDPHHPQELIDVVSRVADHSAEDDQDIVDVQGAHDLVGGALVGRHGFANLGRKKIKK